MHCTSFGPSGLSLGCFLILSMLSEPALATSGSQFYAEGGRAETARLSTPMMAAKTLGANGSDNAAKQHVWLVSKTEDAVVWGKGKGKDDKKDAYEDEDEDEYQDEKKDVVEEDAEEEAGPDDVVVTPPVPEVAVSDPIEPVARPDAGAPAVIADLESGGGSASDVLPMPDDPFNPFFEDNVSGQSLANILIYFGLQDRFAALSDDGIVDIVWLEFERKASLKGLSLLISGTNRDPDLSATVGRLAVLIFLDQSTITRQSDVIAVFGNGAYEAAPRPLR